MDIDPAAVPPSERDVGAERQLAREAEMLAEAWADVTAGRLVSLEAVEAWVASWGTANELDAPSTPR